MNIHRLAGLAAATIALLLRAAQAQEPQDMLELYRTEWKDQPGVYLKMNTTIRVERTKDGVIAHRTVEQEKLAMKPPSSQVVQEEVGYSKLVPLDDIHAWTLVPKDRSYKKVQVEEFTHRDKLDDQIFHDDSREVQFHFSGLATGAITHLDYTVSYPDAHMIAGHYFAHAYPVEESVLTVICDKDIEVVGHLFNIPEGSIRSERTVEHGKTVQRWTMTQVPALEFEDGAPDIRYYIPHLQLSLREPEDEGSNDLDRMYAWDAQHVRDVMLDDDTLLQRITREATAGLTDDRAKAAALYGWMQDNITYVAVEDGMNGLIPAKPLDVCTSRYGDCKGMANLLRALLHNAGLKAYLTWVGSRNLPYRYDDLPSPAVDDHMITAWDDGHDLMLLDATSRETPFGMPSAFIQGKQALVGIDAGHFRIVEVPVADASVNALVDSVHAHLEGTTLKGTGSWTFTGYQRASMKATLDRSDKNKWNLLMSGMRVKVNNRFQVDSVKVEGLEHRDRPLVIRYWFTLPAFMNASGEERYLPRLLDNTFMDRDYRKDRKLAVEEDYRWTSHEVVSIDLPPGMTTGFVPEAAVEDGPGFGYTLRSETVAASKDGPAHILLDDRFHMDRLMLELGDLPAWRTMMDHLHRDQNRTIVLKHSAP